MINSQPNWVIWAIIESLHAARLVLLKIGETALLRPEVREVTSSYEADLWPDGQPYLEMYVEIFLHQGGSVCAFLEISFLGLECCISSRVSTTKRTGQEIGGTLASRTTRTTAELLLALQETAEDLSRHMGELDLGEIDSPV